MSHSDSVVRKILDELEGFPLSKFFLREGLRQLADAETMREWRFFCNFFNSPQMLTLEKILADGLKVFQLDKTTMRKRAEYAFGAKFNKENFESFRGVLRAGISLSAEGFTGLCLTSRGRRGDFTGVHSSARYAVEVKTWVYEEQEPLSLDPNSKKSKTEHFQRKLSSDHLPSAGSALAVLAREESCSKRLLVVVVNHDFLNWWFEAKEYEETYQAVRSALAKEEIDVICFLDDKGTYIYPPLAS